MDNHRHYHVWFILLQFQGVTAVCVVEYLHVIEAEDAAWALEKGDFCERRQTCMRNLGTQPLGYTTIITRVKRI